MAKGADTSLLGNLLNTLSARILELAEGNLATVACLVPGAEVCSREEQCITLPLWKKFDGMVHDFFYEITLEDVLNGNI